MSSRSQHSVASETDAVKPASSPLEGEPNRIKRFGGGHNQRNTPNAQKMRKEMTAWEFRLWLRLKNKQLGGFKFRRQQPVGPYIVDFLNTDHRVVVELDGSQHVDSVGDYRRDQYLMQRGYSVLRFWNTDVNANLEGVLTAILRVLDDTPHQTTPHRAFVARISDAAWEVVWLPLKGGARCGESVPNDATMESA